PAVLGISQQYMKSEGIHTGPAMWWTTPYGCEKSSSALAQQYHFDMDTVKFIKYFIYLTDVGPGDGPHCFVRRSHLRRPKELLRDGRFQDEEINQSYDRSDVLEFTAPKGTIIAEDTRGLHKAKMPTDGNRLILQLEMTSCLFGPGYPKSTVYVNSN